MARGHMYTVAICILFAIVLISRSGSSILTPLWLDSLNNNTANQTCDTTPTERRVDPFTTMFLVNLLFVLITGAAVLWAKCFYRALLTEADTSYSKGQFALIGVSDTLAGVCFVYASSGCRTAPYLQALVGNFSVPVTFIVRFVVLRKRPTWRKTACAVAILIAEFMALIPSIFPSLQSHAATRYAGGAGGIAGVLWPMCFLFGYIPLAIVSTVMEKAVKPSHQNDIRLDSRTGNDTSPDMNIAYMLFWCYLFSLITLMLMFWTDIIPGFGMADGIKEFGRVFWFNIKCFIGLEGCHGAITVYSLLCTVLLLGMRVSNSYFLRHLEGANYLAIVSTLQTPIVFLFFTLFDENPFRWHPHTYLSTWLSIGALAIMLPAIYVYDTGAPEVTLDRGGYSVNRESGLNETDDQSTPYTPLLQAADKYDPYGSSAIY